MAHLSKGMLEVLFKDVLEGVVLPAMKLVGEGQATK